MRRATRITAASLLVALLTNAAPAQTASPAKPDRSKPPALGPVRALKLPPTQKLKLANGVPVLLVELHEVPVVQVNVIVRAGAGADPLDKPGLASLTADMMDEGAGSRTALQIADELDYLGADLGTLARWDASGVALHVPAKRLAAALPIFADVVLRPTFPPSELERVRKDRLTALLQARDEPPTIAAVAFANALYGRSHRYGTPVMGTEASVRGFSRDDLVSSHQRAFQPANAAIVVVGDVVPATIQKDLDAAFGSWKAGAEAAPAAVPAASQVTERGIWIVDRPGSAQSEIRIGRVGPPRSTQDYFPLTVMNTILGGSFTSRLMQNLRETHGYAYGARSSFDYRLSTGPFTASAAVQTDKTGPAISEFFKELEAIRKTVTEPEVGKAKNYVALSFPSDVETTGDIAQKLAEQFIYELPDGWLDAYVQKISAVTLADVQRVANQYVDPAKVIVVVVGDRKKIEPEVRALNLGPVQVRSVEEVFGVAAKRAAR